MRLLRVIPSLDPASGGVAAAARAIDLAFSNNGHQVQVACLDRPEAPWISGWPVPVVALGPSLLKYRFNTRLVQWLRSNGSQYDAILVDGLWQYHSYAVSKVLGSCNTPYFIFTHGMLSDWFRRAHPLKHIKKLAYWMLAERNVLEHAHCVIYTADQERRSAHKSFHYLSHKESVIPLGIDVTNSFSSREKLESKYPSLCGKRIWLFLGRLNPIKGCDLLIRAFAEVSLHDPSLHLVIAGPSTSSYKGTLMHLASTLGVASKITWPGMVSGPEKWGFYNEAELFCLPSHQENFGMVVAESLSVGTPVLLSDQVNICRDVEVDGAAIVKPDTLTGTIDGMREWLALTSEDKHVMSQAASRCYIQRYSSRNTVNALLAEINNAFEP